MKKSDFYYDLPKELIAQSPLKDRTSSKLLVVNRKSGEIVDEHFYNISNYLKEGDVLVLNNTKVIPARLIGKRLGGDALIEILLLKRLDKNKWECLSRPGKKTRLGCKIFFGDNILQGEIIDVLEDGNRIIEFKYDGIFEEVLDELGQMPLPPYITEKLTDKQRYQTVYAKEEGSSAAPTAGLHFSKELLLELKNNNVQVEEVTLHVGLGTFRPVKESIITNHKMHSEFYTINKETADRINIAKKNNRRIIAVGTTSLRALESSCGSDGLVRPYKGETNIFIYPGYKFKVVDSLITNFHLPESTLIMLVSAFYTREKILEVYNYAIKNKYRFFSFGDAMFIL